VCATPGRIRHARLMAALLVRRFGVPPFSWGGRSLRETSELRTGYIAALRAADNHDIGPLLAFARSQGVIEGPEGAFGSRGRRNRLG
jgi:fido (protein-threonine AMPylation protein)